MSRKRNLAVFIDGENVPAKHADRIMEIAGKEGYTDFIKVYGLQKDKSTRKWSDVAAVTQNMKDIRLYGPPTKDKVDRKIKKDMMKDIDMCKNIDIVMIVSSDHGYTDSVSSLKTMGKRVVVVSDKTCSKKLRTASTKFIPI